MIVYSLGIFFHVCAAVGLFVALGVETVSLGRLRRATTRAEAQTWLALLQLPSRVGPVAMVTAFATGVLLTALTWGRQPWIASSMLGLVAMAASGVFSMRSARRVRAALASETDPALSPAFVALPSLSGWSATLRMRIAIGVGILGLMTMKPDAAFAWPMLGASTALGLVLALRASSSPRSPSR